MKCPNCAGDIPTGATRCLKCGTHVEPQPPAAPMYAAQAAPPMQPAGPYVQPGPMVQSTRSKIVAGLLGIFLGGLGVHRFYLGFHAIGAAQLILFVAGMPLIMACGVGAFMMIGAGIWGLVEGIMILAGAINTDAEGRVLAP